MTNRNLAWNCNLIEFIMKSLLQDFSLNMEEVKELTEQFHPELVIIESGGDNLAANFSRELADFIIYVVDVAGK